MWNPTPSSSAASTSDNKQDIREAVDVGDCKCIIGLELNQQYEQSNFNKLQTSNFAGPLSTSDNIKQLEKGGLSEVEETIDSGFISGPQTSSSAICHTENETFGIGSADIKKLNVAEPSSDSQLHNKTHLQQSNLDSGIIEKEYEEEDCGFEEQRNLTNEEKMILPNNVESGISELFSNLSLQNNPNVNAAHTNASTSADASGLNNLGAATQQSSRQETKTYPQLQQKHTATIPQQITPTNAWETYYQQNDDGNTILHLACMYGYEDVVTALIRMAPHPCLFNIQNDAAQTPLHLATLATHPKIIRMLLIAGVKPTIRDCHGNTALHLACISGEEQCVRALTIPISASEVNEAHRHYGHRANDKSYLKCAQLPIDLEIRNYVGQTCIHIASEAGFINILRILVLYGGDINAREGLAGRTPLHIAIRGCNEELTNYLLDECQKLNLETPTYAGLTAYQVACILNKSEILIILEKRGAEPLTPPDSDCDSSDSDIDDSDKFYDRFGDPGYFAAYNSGNVMAVA